MPGEQNSTEQALTTHFSSRWGRTSPPLLPGGSMVLDLCVKGDARSPPLPGAVSVYGGASPHSLSSREMRWGADTLQQALDGSPLDTELV